MATAKKLPSGNYRCRVYDNKTKTTKSFTAPTKKEAEYLAAEWLADRKPKPTINKTFFDACEDYIALKSEILSPTTIDKYRCIFEKQITEGFRQAKLGSLDGIAIQSEINQLSAQYSPKTVHNIHGLISAVLRTYVPGLHYNITLPKIQKHFRDIPSADEIIPIFHGDEIEVFVLLAVWQGLRESEILGLKKSDVKNGILTVNRVVVRITGGKVIVKDTAKTVDSRRPLILPKRIQELIAAVPVGDDDFLTTLTGNAIYKRFILRMKKAGYPGITFHDLRHVNASTMHLLGVPDKYAMERGGWSNSATLQKVYQETFSAERLIVDQRIDNYFENIFTTKLAAKNNKADNNDDLSA